MVGEALGYSMGMSLNKAYPLIGRYDAEWHYMLISAVGPFITLLQSFACYLLITRTHNSFIYPFLFSAFYLELLSGIMNFRHTNDLGRISNYYHLGLFTIPALFVLLHSLLIYKTTRREKYTWKFIGWTFLLILLFSSIWILLNNKYSK